MNPAKVMALASAIAVGTTGSPARAAPPAEDIGEPSETEPAGEPQLADQARTHYVRGDRLFRDGKPLQAAQEFERSYAAIPMAGTLFNIAVSYASAGRPLDAIAAAERYLDRLDCTAADIADPNACEAKRDKVRKLQDEQRRKVGELLLVVTRGVELERVVVAGKTVPLDAFPMLLMPGEVEVELEGKDSAERRKQRVEVPVGGRATVYVTPFAEPAPPPRVTDSPKSPESDPTAPTARARPDRQRALRATFWTGVGLSSASAIGLAVVGGLTLYSQRRFNEELCENPCNQTESGMMIPEGDPRFQDHPEDHRERFYDLLPITNAMIGVTAGLVLVTTIVGVFAFADPRARSSPNRASTKVRRVGIAPSGVTLRW